MLQSHCNNDGWLDLNVGVGVGVGVAVDMDVRATQSQGRDPKIFAVASPQC